MIGLNWPEAFLFGLCAVVFGAVLIFSPVHVTAAYAATPQGPEYFAVLNGIVVDVQDDVIDARGLVNTNIENPRVVVGDGFDWEDRFPINCKDIGTMMVYVDAPNLAAPLQTYVIIQDSSGLCGVAP